MRESVDDRDFLWDGECAKGVGETGDSSGEDFFGGGWDCVLFGDRSGDVGKENSRCHQVGTFVGLLVSLGAILKFQSIDRGEVLAAEMRGRDLCIAQRHFDAPVAEELHDGDDADAAGEERGGIGVAESMKGDRFVLIRETCSQSAEKRVETVIGARDGTSDADEAMRIDRTAADSARGLEQVDYIDRLLAEGDEAFVVHFAEGDFEESFVAGGGDRAVGGEVDELADAETCEPEEEKGFCAAMVRGAQAIDEQSVGLLRERSREIVRDDGETRAIESSQGGGGERSAIDLTSEEFSDDEELLDLRVRRKALAMEVFKVAIEASPIDHGDVRLPRAIGAKLAAEESAELPERGVF